MLRDRQTFDVALADTVNRPTPMHGGNTENYYHQIRNSHKE